jgi:hypothetical protein
MNTQFIIEAIALMGVCFAIYKFVKLSQKVSELEEDVRSARVYSANRYTELNDKITEAAKDIDCLIDDVDSLLK